MKAYLAKKAISYSKNDSLYSKKSLTFIGSDDKLFWPLG